MICHRFLPRCTRAHRARGFSVYELLVTLGIAGGVTATTVPLIKLFSDQRASAAANALVAELALARSEAVHRRQEIKLCPSAAGGACDPPGTFAWWHGGMLMFADADGDGRRDAEDWTLRHSTADDGVTIKTSAARAQIVFQPNGTSGGSTATFTVCGRGGAARYVIVTNVGRVRVSTTPPDGRADEALERCP